jgi:CHAD domain-containing protein
MPINIKRSRDLFQKLERDLSGLPAKPSAKSVHGFRTGTRRLQILLGELSPKLDRNEKKLLKQLNRIRKRAGKLRDLDVQLGALRTLKVPREPRRKAHLINRLIEQRAQQEKKLRKAADGEIVREIRKRLKRAAKHFNAQEGKYKDPLTVAKGMLENFEAGVDPVTEAMLHQYRILTKRARYAAEFAAPAADAASLIAELKLIQDALGDWHDWLTLRQNATADLGDPRESPLVAELHNVTGAKYRRAVAALATMRSKMSDNKPTDMPVPPRVPAKAPQQAIPAA